MTLLAHKYALDPNAHQARALYGHAGASRVAFNWGLAWVKANLDQREAEESYGITGDDLTPYVDWSFYGLRKAWNQVKDDVAPWWRDNSKEAYASGLRALADALKNWRGSKNGTRKGPKMGFPKWRRRHGATPKFRFTTGALRCETTHVVLPVIGRVKLHERATRTVSGDVRVLSASVRFERDRWFVSFTVETPDVHLPVALDPSAVVGVDLGIKTLAVLSTGEVVQNPKHLHQAQKRLRRASRRLSRRTGPDRRARTAPSNRWLRAKAQLAAVHHRVADLRTETNHAFTTSLTARFGTVVVEDLHVAGMVKNRRLARSISDAGWAEIRRQIEYKARWRGGRVIVAGRFFPSSKTCSDCGAVRAKLLLSERTYVCAACGLVKDRDENAADNLAEYGARMIAESGSEIENGRGADRKTPSGVQVTVKRQPGTRQRGQTGTVPRQRGTVSEEAHS